MLPLQLAMATPVPEALATLVPAAEPMQVPEVLHTLVPAAEPMQVPEVLHTVVPAAEPMQVPEVLHTLVPAAELIPVPEALATLVPAAELMQVPEVLHTVVPAEQGEFRPTAARAAADHKRPPPIGSRYGGRPPSLTPVAEERGHQAARAGCYARRIGAQLQRQPGDDFEIGSALKRLRCDPLKLAS
jgi:Cornifin (SPRR) family